MPDKDMLNLDELREQDRPGLQLGGKVYPWVLVGPIESASYTKMQRDIVTLGDTLRSKPKGQEQADILKVGQEIARLQRQMMRMILPTLPDEVDKTITDEEVQKIIRFFDVLQMDEAADQLEAQMQPAERVDQIARRAQGIGAISSRNFSGTSEATPPGG